MQFVPKDNESQKADYKSDQLCSDKKVGSYRQKSDAECKNIWSALINQTWKSTLVWFPRWKNEDFKEFHPLNGPEKCKQKRSKTLHNLSVN